MNDTAKERPLRVPILMYHNIGEHKARQDKPYFVSLKRFEAQMAFLRNAGYNAVGLMDIVNWLRYDEALPEMPIGITFDDGSGTIYTGAFPILSSYGIKATVFLTVNYIEGNGAVERSLLRSRPLSWEEILKMQEGGISFQSHTLSHSLLTDTGSDDAYLEMERSKQLLEERLGKRVDLLSYPHGLCNAALAGMARKTGYAGAVLSYGGVNEKGTDPYMLQRIAVFENDTDQQLKLKLTFCTDKVTAGFMASYYWSRLIGRILNRKDG